MYRIIKLLCCIPETNITLYVNNTSIFKNHGYHNLIKHTSTILSTGVICIFNHSLIHSFNKYLLSICYNITTLETKHENYIVF